jgi:hypothetical protein
MASTINAAVGGVVITSDSSGALNIQAGGVTAIEIGASASVIISNLALPTSLTLTTLNATSASITTLSGTTATYTSANITTLTGSSATITNILDGSGNVRNIPSAGTAKTTAYTLTVSDIGEFVTVGTSGSITVPNDTFATGNAVSIYNDTTGNISINCPITTAYLTGTNTDRASLTLATRGIANILFINPSYCIASGNLT